MYLPRESVSLAARWWVGARVHQRPESVAERSLAAATPVAMAAAAPGWRRPNAAASAVATVAAVSASDPTAVAAEGSAATAAGLVALARAVQLEMEMCLVWVYWACCSRASGAWQPTGSRPTYPGGSLTSWPRSTG